MTSKSIIKMTAEKMGVSQRQVKEFADALEDSFKDIIEELPVDEKVKLMDFTLVKKDVASRQGRNPSTGESMVIPATKKLTVKPSGEVKRIVKGM